MKDKNKERLTVILRLNRRQAECLWSNLDHHASESDDALVRKSSRIVADALVEVLAKLPKIYEK